MKNKMGPIQKGALAIFYFGFFCLLIYQSYLYWMDQKYGALIFMIPFLGVGIFLVRYSFFSKKKEWCPRADLKIFPGNIFHFVCCLLIGIHVSTGIFLLRLGVKEADLEQKEMQDYQSTAAYYYGSRSENRDDGPMYYHTYSYWVQGKRYFIETGYSTNYLPSSNSTKTVKYNPARPEESVLIGMNKGNTMVIVGALLVIIPLIVGFLVVVPNSYLNKFKVDLIGIMMGLGLFFFGGGFLLFQGISGEAMMEALRSFDLFFLVPVMMVILGFFLFLKSFFPKKKQVK